MQLFPLLAQQAPDPAASCLQSSVFIFLIVGIFWFFLIRPQQKQLQEIEAFRKSLKTGDQVITNGGIYGKIVELDESKVVLEVAPRTKFKVTRESIARRQSDEGDAKDSPSS